MTDPAFREAVTWLLLIAIVYGCYRLDQRRQRRRVERDRRWRERQQERYYRMEFDVNPPLFDQDTEEAA